MSNYKFHCVIYLFIHFVGRNKLRASNHFLVKITFTCLFLNPRMLIHWDQIPREKLLSWEVDII